ncbi:AAA-like domain-containing protein [Calothrix rhizosoleniae]|uniref:AAA-like domain-containing protein n=1 Tax=Calothrix rhizosoleniae TaxID=888997 RepID=UPI001F25D6D4|nr:AAA-like domain-containing protein [Calothrix rhizosoleniae]
MRGELCLDGYGQNLAMYDVVTSKTSFQNLLESATTEAGIYSHHLRYLLDILRDAPIYPTFRT